MNDIKLFFILKIYNYTNVLQQFIKFVICAYIFDTLNDFACIKFFTIMLSINKKLLEFTSNFNITQMFKK